MSTSPRIVVVQGGPSSEAEVSRVSAAAVVRALRTRDHQVRVVECDRTLASALVAEPVDVVFPVVHGAVGEDGCLQGLLEVLELPYVGAGVLASALANDKVLTKQVLGDARLPLLPHAVLGDAVADQSEALRALAVDATGTERRGFVVKPARQGSALGISLLPDATVSDRRVREAIELARTYDDKVLVEPFAAGREVTCGVLDSPLRPTIALPPTEIRAKAAGWYDFQSKYGAGGSEHRCPAPLHANTLARVQEAALLAHRALGVRDLSRSDFIIEEDSATPRIALLEVNTLPGMTATSLYPEQAAAAGIAFDELCELLVLGAYRRGPSRRNAAAPFPT